MKPHISSKCRDFAVSLIFALLLGILPTVPLTADAAAKMTLSASNLTLVKTQTKKLTVKNLPKKATVSYRSSKKAVATVSKKGVITAKKNGKATITATVKKNNQSTKLKCTVTVLKVSDPEINRAVKLGIVTANYMKKPTENATYNDLSDILGNVIKKRRKGKLSEWNAMVNPSEKTFQVQQAVVPLYRAACLIETDGIPKGNMTQNDWYVIPYYGSWDAWLGQEAGELSYEEFLPDFSWDTGSYPFVEPTAEASGRENPIYEDFESVAAGKYVDVLGSNYSKNPVIAVDTKTHLRPFKETMTRERLALIAVRFYDSFEKTPNYTSIANLANGSTISKAALKKAKTFPTLSAKKLPSDWKGSVLWNLHSTLGTGENQMWHYYPADVKLMAEQGMNVVSVLISFALFAGPDYDSQNPERVNKNYLEELDALIDLCLKNNLVVLLEGRGVTGRGKILYDDTPNGYFYAENLLDPTFATESEWERWEAIWTAIAKRYQDVSPNALLFGICNEPSIANEAQLHTASAHYTSVIKKIRNVSKNRILYMQADSSSYDYEGNWNDYHKEFVEFFAKQGVCLGAHSYTPQAFYEERYGANVTWPYTDADGVRWDAEAVYEKTIKPVCDIADANGVGFFVSEYGLGQAMEDESTDEGWDESLVLSYYTDMTAMYKRHGISALPWMWGGNATGSLTSFGDVFSMRRGATVKARTYDFGDYQYTLYYDPALLSLFTK